MAKRGKPTTKAQIEKRIAELEARRKEAKELAHQIKTDNPFWFYQPVTGDLSTERRTFLETYLKREDIPQKLDSAVDVHLSEAPIRGASGGNQSSKTTLGCIEGVIKATGAVPLVFDKTKPQTCKHPYPESRLKRSGPQHVRVIGEDYQNGVVRNLIPTFRKWSPKEYLLNGRWDRSYSAGEQTLRYFHPKTKELVGTVEFMSNKQDLGTFQGPPRHMLIFDEEPMQDVYKENLMRLTTAGKMDVLFTMTPTKGLSWTHDLYSEGRDKSGNHIDWYQIASVCNPHANLNVLAEIMAEITSYDERRMRLLGEFVSLSGLIYGKLFNHRTHVIPPFTTSCTCGTASRSHVPQCPYNIYQSYVGMDPHLSKASVAVLAVLDRDNNFIVDRCYKREADVEQYKRGIHEEFELDKRRLKNAICDVSARANHTIYSNRSIFDDLQKNPYRIPKLLPSEKFKGSIHRGVDMVKRLLQIHPISQKPKFFIMDRPENQGLIKSMRTLQRDTYANEDKQGVRDKIQEGMHDEHAAMRYITQLNLRWHSPVDESQIMDSIFMQPEAVNY